MAVKTDTGNQGEKLEETPPSQGERPNPLILNFRLQDCGAIHLRCLSICLWSLVTAALVNCCLVPAPCCVPAGLPKPQSTVSQAACLADTKLWSWAENLQSVWQELLQIFSEVPLDRTGPCAQALGTSSARTGCRQTSGRILHVKGTQPFCFLQLDVLQGGAGSIFCWAICPFCSVIARGADMRDTEWCLSPWS